jgi:hypothetical protein
MNRTPQNENASSGQRGAERLFIRRERRQDCARDRIRAVTAACTEKQRAADRNEQVGCAGSEQTDVLQGAIASLSG